MKRFDDTVKNKIYKYSVYTISPLIMLYFFIQFLIIENYLTLNSSLTFLFTGPAKICVVGDVLKISMNKQINEIEIIFSDEIERNDLITNDNDIKILKSDDNFQLIIKAKNSSLLNRKIDVLISGNKTIGSPINRKILKITVNNNGIFYDVNLKEFYENYINKKYSNLTIYYPFHYGNISNELANKVGNPLLYMIIYALYIMLAFQIIMLFVNFIIREKEIILFLRSSGSSSEINFMDFISSEYSIYFGFLGTVCSLWIALETSSVDLKSINSVIDLMKNGIFTTVLGLIIKLICSARSLVPIED